jgi:hypothetical protein
MPGPVVPLELDLDDLDPISEIRPIDTGVRRLVIDTRLRGKAAEQAWVSVSDESGAVHFEGAPSTDGCIVVSFEHAPAVERVRVLLETSRSHRQAELALGPGWTTHAFT